ncbi:MAG: glycerophosphodiester phosphodiesterase [Clostridia bacterium]|nr:glycerophosphodiester phosphodiesterase [Clostridia bacterium]
MANSASELWNRPSGRIMVAGHRGWPEIYPENTLDSFRAALKTGVDMIETDVRISADGEPVLIHDATLDRTTDGSGEVRAFTLAELRKLDAGSWKDRAFYLARIPVLSELFDLLEEYPEALVNIELKEAPEREDGWKSTAFGLCDRVVGDLLDRGLGERAVINSFSASVITYVKKKYGDAVRTHVYFPMDIMYGDGEPYEGAYCACVNEPQSEGEIRAAREFSEKTGIRLWGGAFVHDEETLDKAAEYGVELVTVNNPKKILSIMRGKGLHS